MPWETTAECFDHMTCITSCVPASLNNRALCYPTKMTWQRRVKWTVPPHGPCTCAMRTRRVPANLHERAKLSVEKWREAVRQAMVWVVLPGRGRGGCVRHGLTRVLYLASPSAETGGAPRRKFGGTAVPFAIPLLPLTIRRQKLRHTKSHNHQHRDINNIDIIDISIAVITTNTTTTLLSLLSM